MVAALGLNVKLWRRWISSGLSADYDRTFEIELRKRVESYYGQTSAAAMTSSSSATQLNPTAAASAESSSHSVTVPD